MKVHLNVNLLRVAIFAVCFWTGTVVATNFFPAMQATLAMVAGAGIFMVSEWFSYTVLTRKRKTVKVSDSDKKVVLDHINTKAYLTKLMDTQQCNQMAQIAFMGMEHGVSLQDTLKRVDGTIADWRKFLEGTLDIDATFKHLPEEIRTLMKEGMAAGQKLKEEEEEERTLH